MGLLLKGFKDPVEYHGEQCFLVPVFKFPFGGMYIYIAFVPRKLQEKDRKGKTMLHDIGLVGLFDGPVYDLRLDISSVHVIVLEAPVSTVEERLANEAVHPELPLPVIHGKK